LQGASAIETALAERPDVAVRAFLVWQPVLDTDRDPPSDQAQARATDDRARHFWDPTQRLASLWQPVLKQDKTPLLGKAKLVTGDVLWDFVAVFPPGAQWTATTPPPPVFKAAPVADFGAELARALSIAGR
jgi:hypothetical protein